MWQTSGHTPVLWRRGVANALTLLPEAARTYLEAKVATEQFEYMSAFTQRYVDKGRVEGRAEDVIAVLESRGIDVSGWVRELVTTCTDPEQLDQWLRRAATVTSADELFA